MLFRNPKFGNTYSTDPGVKVRRTLDGELLQAYDSQWPLNRSFTMVFEALSKSQIDQLEAFLVSSAGLEINMTDHEGFDWAVLVKSDPVVFTQVGRDCLWSTEIECIGRKL